MRRSSWYVPVMTLALTAGGALLAQERVDLNAMAAKMRQNQEELRRYSWDTTMEFRIDGEQRRVDTYHVRYVMGGMLEKMQIASEVGKGPVRGPDGKKLKKKELEAAREFVLSVKDQLDGYLNPLFAEKAVATASTRIDDGTLILESRNVVTAGDSVVITFRASTRQPLTAVIRTTVEGTPVALDVSFGSIEYGPNYPSRSVTSSEWRGMAVTITTEDSNHQRLGG